MRNIFIILFLVFSVCCYTPIAEAGKGKRITQKKKVYKKLPPVDDPFFVEKYSKYLGVNLDSCTNRRLIAELASWIGVPYARGGISKRGADCSGFVYAIYRKLYGIYLPHGGITMLREMKKIIPKKNLEEGDILFFREHGFVSHVAIYLKDSKFIHASTPGRGVVVDDLRTPYYKRTYYTAGRAIVPEVIVVE